MGGGAGAGAGPPSEDTVHSDTHRKCECVSQRPSTYLINVGGTTDTAMWRFLVRITQPKEEYRLVIWHMRVFGGGF